MTRHDWLATATLALVLSGCADQKEQANLVMTSQPEQQQIAYQVASKSIVLLQVLYGQGYASRPQQWGGKPVIDEKVEARKAIFHVGSSSATLPLSAEVMI